MQRRTDEGKGEQTGRGNGAPAPTLTPTPTTGRVRRRILRKGPGRKRKDKGQGHTGCRDSTNVRAGRAGAKPRPMHFQKFEILAIGSRFWAEGEGTYRRGGRGPRLKAVASGLWTGTTVMPGRLRMSR